MKKIKLLAVSLLFMSTSALLYFTSIAGDCNETLVAKECMEGVGKCLFYDSGTHCNIQGRVAKVIPPAEEESIKL